MKIPGAERAIVDEAKVRDYLLSPEHRVGSAKARFFAQLGFDRGNPIRDRVSRSEIMTALFHELDTVVLLRELPEAGLLLGILAQSYRCTALRR